MTSPVGPLAPIGKLLTRIMPWDNTWFGKNILGVGDTAHDIVQISRGGRMSNPNLFNRLFQVMPSPIQKGFGKTVQLFDQFPGMKSLSASVKFSVMKLGLAYGVFDSIKAGVEGFLRSQQGIGLRVLNGTTSAVRSAAKTLGLIGLSVAVASSIPWILGVSALGTVGIITSTLGSLLVASWGKKWMDKHLPTHVSPEPRQVLIPLQPIQNDQFQKFSAR